jgi:Concanavalin A-like lectin/glucanases superfamily
VVITVYAPDVRARPDYAQVQWFGRDTGQSGSTRFPPNGTLFRGSAELGTIHVFLNHNDRSDRRVVITGYRGEERVSSGSSLISWMLDRQYLDVQLMPVDTVTVLDAGAPEPDAALPRDAAVEAPRSLGLVLRYAFDEEGGDRAVDSSGRGFDGRLVGVGGVPTFSTNVPPVTFVDPHSLSFDKSKRQAVQLSPAPLELKARAVTIAAWYRATAVDDQGSEILSCGDNYRLRLFADRIEAEERTGSGVLGRFPCSASSTTLLDGNWHHVAAAIRDQDITIYYDGKQAGMCSSGVPIAYDQGPDLWIGRHGNGGIASDFDGNLDEVRVYDRQLNASDIATLAARR